jgi:hypothetical protein
MLKSQTKIIVGLLLSSACAACIAGVLLRQGTTKVIVVHDAVVVIADQSGGLTVIALNDSKTSRLYILQIPRELLIVTLSYPARSESDTTGASSRKALVKSMPAPGKWWRLAYPHWIDVATAAAGPLRFAVYFSLWHVAAACVVLAAGIAWRARRATRIGSCPQCSYNLTGLASKAPCPECGRSPTPHESLDAARPSPPPRA